MRWVLLTIGLGVSLAACSRNTPLAGGSERPAGATDVPGAAGRGGSSSGRHGSPEGPTVVVAPAAGDASAPDGAPGRGVPDGSASDGAALDGGPADGAGESRDAPARCPGAAGCARAATAIAIGGDGPWQACARFDDGTVECWTNGTAPLGSATAPLRVPGLTGATAVSVGAENACALLDGGKVACWINTAGNAYALPGPPITTPTIVAGLDGATAIAIGEMHSCALVAGGAVRCWGVNDFGELGDGTTIDSATPVGVSGLADATTIAVGIYHSCALRAGGEVVCWGDNEQGYLGDGTRVSATTPVAVPGAAGALAISTSGTTTCALLPGGVVSCWGDLFRGDMMTYALMPTPAPGLTGAKTIAAGWAYACAATAAKVICWGADGQGQLGDGLPKTFGPPVVVPELDDPTAPIAIAATTFRACVLHDDRRVSCWGARTYFSTGMTTLDLTPTLVGGL